LSAMLCSYTGEWTIFVGGGKLSNYIIFVNFATQS